MLGALSTRAAADLTAPVSDLVAAIMTAVSVAASWAGPPLRRMLGLAGLLLLGFAMQIGPTAALAASANVLGIGLLFLRMVPDALSKPFILARIQPQPHDATRSTYLSLQSLAGRLLFASSLVAAAGARQDAGPLSQARLQPILTVYATVGAAALLALALSSRRIAMIQADLRTK